MGFRKVLCVLAVLSQTSALLTSPPRMVKQPPSEELLFQVPQPGEADKPFIIECEAEGEPVPQYRWIKNGKPFEFSSYDNRISQQLGRAGTLFFNYPRNEDMGQYQCFAWNEWGTASSNSVFVRKSELNSFNETTDSKTLKASEGQPFKLPCVPPYGYPKPKVYWMLQGDQGQLKTINNSRITFDPEGNLWFSNVTRQDESVDYAYICIAKSLFRNEYKLSNKVYLIVEPTGISAALNKHEPVEQYVTRKVETALKGRRTELYCIYGGTPLPQVVWTKNGQTILPSQDITQDNYGKTLVIKHTKYDDNGTYTCEVSNGVGTAKSHSIELKVEAAPFFVEEPQFQFLVENETAVIRCRAGGNPSPQISWVHNGRPIEYAEPNPRRQVRADEIIITNLTKKDTGNYGCNATNSVGYVYKDVFINVQSP